LCEAVDKTFAGSTWKVEVLRKFGRDVVPQYDSSPALHQEKGCSGHCRVLAQQEDTWGRWKYGMYGFEHAKLACHVVRFRRHRTERRATQDIFTIASPDEICEVRMAAGELLNRESPIGALYFAAQIFGKSGHVDLLAQANGSDFGKHRKF